MSYVKKMYMVSMSQIVMVFSSFLSIIVAMVIYYHSGYYLRNAFFNVFTSEEFQNAAGESIDKLGNSVRKNWEAVQKDCYDYESKASKEIYGEEVSDVNYKEFMSKKND